MTVSLASIAKLRNAGLSAEQMAAVLGVLLDELTPREDRRERDRERSAVRRVRMGVGHSEWQELRQQVFKRDECTCQYCGLIGDTVDHVIPLAAGGPTDMSNLVVACRDCNSSKQDRPVTEWEASRC